MTNTPRDNKQHAITIERALGPDGSETYTIALCASHAAVLTGAAALANMDPGRWVLLAVGNAIADAAGGRGPSPGHAARRTDALMPDDDAWQRYCARHPFPATRADWCERCEAPALLTDLDPPSTLVCRHSLIERTMYKAWQAWRPPSRQP